MKKLYSLLTVLTVLKRVPVLISSIIFIVVLHLIAIVVAAVASLVLFLLQVIFVEVKSAQQELQVGLVLA